MNVRTERLERARRVVGDRVYLTRDLPTVRYLTGFSGSNATLLIHHAGATLITDGRYLDQAQGETDGVAIVIDRNAMAAVVALGPESVSVDPSVSIADVDQLRRAGVDVSIAETSLREIRAVKDFRELDALSRACDITARALVALTSEISQGDTEVALARRLETLFGDLGAEDRAFPTIVATGPNSAIPHHRPTMRPLHAGDLLVIDCGAMVDGYHADMTRTFVVGSEPAPWQVEIHEVVRAAQQAGIEAAKAGVSAGDVDSVVRRVIADADFEDRFTHGTGHGVGLQIHEPPMVVRGSVDSISAGSPITIEPGIYLPGRGGVRIEDTIVVGNPPRVLTEARRDLMIVG